MKIRYNFGPNAGKTAHAERSQATQLLIDAGVIEEVQDSAQQKTGLQAHNPAAGPYIQQQKEPRWAVVQLPVSGRWAISREHLSGVMYFDGNPDHLTARSFGCGVPEHILAKYREVWRSPAE